ncbi:hypothetical protein GCM10010441_23190 [Kitasatospora paracochleata]
MVSRRGLLGGATIVGMGALIDLAGPGAVAQAETLDTPFTPVLVPHLAQAELMVQYQRMLAAGAVPAGLAGHWPLDGNGADLSGLNRPVTAGPDATWSTARAGGALALGGTAGAYASGPSVVDTTAPFTVAAWVQLGDTTAIRTAVSQDGATTSRFLLHFDPTGGGWSFKVRSADQAQKVAAVAGTPVTANTWTHLTGVWDGANVRLYVNGALAGSAADTTTPWDSPQGLNIGRAKWDGAPANRWIGSVDDVRLWGRALTAAEIAVVGGLTARQNNQYSFATANVVWGQPSDPATWFSQARCASFLTKVLKYTYPWAADGSYHQQWFGASSPEAADYQAGFAGNPGPHFRPVLRPADLRPGDLIAVNYNGSDTRNTGHIVMVRSVKGVYTGSAVYPTETQYAVEIIDCTSDAHGVFGVGNYGTYPDTRMVGAVDADNLQGVGIGHMMFYAANDTGYFSRYRWSVNTASDKTYTVTQRPIAAARVV